MRPVDRRISAIAAWANGERTDIDALARRLDISHRHLSRLSQAAFGLGPRRLANKHRVLRLAVALSTEALADPSDAWTLGYADQSHFIRSFRQFMGVSPGRFAAEPHRFASEVMRARVEIASAHPLGLYLR